MFILETVWYILCCFLTILLGWIWVIDRDDLTDDGRKVIIGVIQTVWFILLVIHITRTI